MSELGSFHRVLPWQSLVGTPSHRHTTITLHSYNTTTMPTQPFASRVNEAKTAIFDNDVAVQAECGSGKSTILLEAVGHCVPKDKNVVIVQPRCIAAHRVADRVADLMGCAIGEDVGYATGDETKCGEYTRFKFVTPMVFVQMCLFERDFQEDLGLVVLDEVHERSATQDLVFAIARGLQTKNPSLRIMLLSNYISKDFWTSYATKAEKIYSLDATGVFLHDNKITHATDPIKRKTIPWEVVRSVRWFNQCEPGAILVFLEGRFVIQEVKALLLTYHPSEFFICMLASGFSPDEQRRAFQEAPMGQRKVI